MPFKPGQSGNPAGKRPGAKCWFTELRLKLRQHIPEAADILLDLVRSGDVQALRLFFHITMPPQRAAYPAIALDLARQSPREVLDTVNASLAAGDISSDHASSILDLLAKERRLETAIALAGRVIDAPMIDTAQSLAAAAVESFDIDTLETAVRTSLPYLQPRPEPLQPEPAGTVSAVPYTAEELGFDAQAEKYKAWEDEWRDQVISPHD